ncbi:MAG: hypothetical protein WB715_07695 [Roseiarcus sp.]|uniref:hypothetical protein n=1 Tax=Roseiarcus sp. TaxID=1969460 RepID=UPI003C567516
MITGVALDQLYREPVRRPIRDLTPLPQDAWVQMPSACSDRFAGDGVAIRRFALTSKPGASSLPVADICK